VFRGGGRPEYRVPGTVPPRRFVPRLHYELLVCGLRGHELIGTDAAELRQSDAVVVREMGGVRWHRCLRCDSWLPLPPPRNPTRRHPPERGQRACAPSRSTAPRRRAPRSHTFLTERPALCGAVANSMSSVAGTVRSEPQSAPCSGSLRDASSER